MKNYNSRKKYILIPKMNKRIRNLIKWCEEIKSGKRKYKSKTRNKKPAMTNSYGWVIKKGRMK